MWGLSIVVLANALSTITVLSCLFLKMPQIASVRELQSSYGIRKQAVFMELTGYSITTMYNYLNNYGFMTYLEYPIILIQLYILVFYILKYERKLKEKYVWIIFLTYVISIVGLYVGLIPKIILNFLVPFTTPLSASAKLSYIYGIVTTGDSSATSLVTWLISVATNMVRIFTVYVDNADINLMINFTVSASLSSAVLACAIYYKIYPSGVKQRNYKLNLQKRIHETKEKDF